MHTPTTTTNHKRTRTRKSTTTNRQPQPPPDAPQAAATPTPPPPPTTDAHAQTEPTHANGDGTQTAPATPTDATTDAALSLADTDPIRAALALMSDTGTTYAQAETDLRQLNARFLPKIIKMVCFLLDGDDLPTARRKAGVSYLLLSYALDCKFFANIYARARRARRAEDVARIEAAQSAMAAGLVARDPDRLPPDPAAAKLILQAHDPLYHAGATAPVTAINIQVNGLPI